jgi:N-acetylglutamate synthase-like GNAT family acetyltransferase
LGVSKNASKPEWRREGIMASIPQLEGCPKDFTLTDGAEIKLRPLNSGGHASLLSLFQRVDEEDLYYLKDTTTDPEVIRDCTHSINLAKVISGIGLVGDKIIADAILHRGRVSARKHVGEVRTVVDLEFRDKGEGGQRLIQELLDVAAELDLDRVSVKPVPERRDAAIDPIKEMGCEQVTALPRRIRDHFGSCKDLLVLEIPLSDRSTWWKE